MWDIIVSLLSGLVGGTIATAIFTWLSKIFQIINLSRKIGTEKVVRVKSCSLKVINSGVETIKDAVGYITLQYDKTKDIASGTEDKAFIDPNHRMNLDGDRLCWALSATTDPNPYKADIYPGEKQLLNICRLNLDQMDSLTGKRIPLIEIPSEQGWNKSRVFLYPQKYEGSLRIVGANIVARDFDFSIIFKNNEIDIILTPGPLPQYSKMMKW